MDDFYKIDKDHLHIMRDAKEVSFEVYIDRKDDSYRRIPDNIEFDELLNIFNEHRMHWVFIHRKNQPRYINGHIEYFEIGGCTMDMYRDYFLFIYVHEKEGVDLLKKYKLMKI